MQSLAEGNLFLLDAGRRLSLKAKCKQLMQSLAEGNLFLLDAGRKLSLKTKCKQLMQGLAEGNLFLLDAGRKFFWREALQCLLWVMIGGIGLFPFTSCSGDDDYQYPSVQLEYLSATTDSRGALHQVTTDGGETWDVLNDRSQFRSTPDTLLRIVSNYLIAEDAQGKRGAELYAVRPVISPIPLPAAEFKKGIKTDATELLSIWMGRDYLNLVMTFKGQSATHKFHFVEERVTTDEATGQREVTLLLYHDKADDVEAYSRRVYLSVPLRHYMEEGITSLLVRFGWMDAKNQRQERSFNY